MAPESGHGLRWMLRCPVPSTRLIEPEHLTGEGHSERQEQKQDSDDPGQFSREFVRAKQKYLRHVNQDDRQHEIRAPPVERPNKPSQGDLGVQNLQASPSLAGGRDIDEGEEDSREKLESEYSESRAAEDIKPTRCFTRHGVLHRLADQRAELKPLIEPCANVFDQAHGGLVRRNAAELPGVGISPALMNSFPFWILKRYSNRPRSGGPDAREPSP